MRQKPQEAGMASRPPLCEPSINHDREGAIMPTLHIEHAITDFDTWVAAFRSFGDARRSAGVRQAHVRRPIDDRQFVVIDLDFDTREEANAFLNFLETVVWQNPANSPALKGVPRTMVLETATDVASTPGI